MLLFLRHLLKSFLTYWQYLVWVEFDGGGSLNNKINSVKKKTDKSEVW